jgi:hypothetical protein
MKVFISYGSIADQVTALRLQALAAVNGLTVYVPPAYTRQGSPTLLEPETGLKLKEADIVLGVVGAPLAESCRQELNTAMTLQKKMIIMSDPVLAPQLQPHFGPNLVVMDPAHPDQAAISIVEHLKTIHAGQNAEKALLALGALALGLLIFANADRT